MVCRGGIYFSCISLLVDMQILVGALRDLKFTLEEPSRNPKVRRILRKTTDSGRRQRKRSRNHDAREARHGTPFGATAARIQLHWRRRLERQAVEGATFSCKFVAPMLIMARHRTLLTTLLTASLFVLVVGLVLAWLMCTAEPKDILTATAV